MIAFTDMMIDMIRDFHRDNEGCNASRLGLRLVLRSGWLVLLFGFGLGYGVSAYGHS